MTTPDEPEQRDSDKALRELYAMDWAYNVAACCLAFCLVVAAVVYMLLE